MHLNSVMYRDNALWRCLFHVLLSFMQRCTCTASRQERAEDGGIPWTGRFVSSEGQLRQARYSMFCPR